MALSCAGVKLAGALVVEFAAQVTASLASATNTMPPGAFAGSVDARGREERAKSTQKCLPSLVLVFLVSSAMPALEPLGRGVEEHPFFSTMLSVRPVTGFRASQLYSFVAVVVWVLL